MAGVVGIHGKTTHWRQFIPTEQEPGPVEAVLWERLEDRDKILCNVCAHRCIIHKGYVGACHVRHNVDGVLYALNYRKTSGFYADPVEKKPLYHFYPGSSLMSLGAPGCNFRCRFCQNSDLSQMPVEYNRIEGRVMEPEAIVEETIRRGCLGIAYTYTEPTIYIEFALEVMGLAKERGLKNVWVSNGYLTPEATELVAPTLDAINIDLKAFNDPFYLKVCGARYRPVCDTIVRMAALGIWTEVTTVVIPGHNDSDDELSAIAGFVARVNRDIPWHISAFHPDYRMLDVPPTPAETLRRAQEIGQAAGLKYVYIGNAPALHAESTLCPGCGHVLIGRKGYSLTEWGLQDGECRRCGLVVPGAGLKTAPELNRKRLGAWPLRP